MSRSNEAEPAADMHFTISTVRPEGMARWLLAAALLVLVALPAAGQQVQRIAAIVNDEVISGYDVERRVDLIVSSGGLPNTTVNRRRLRGQVLRVLVEERLQLQEAVRFGVTVSEAEMNRALANIERQNNLPPGGLEKFLQARRIDRDSLEQQIKAEIAWGKLVRKRFTQTIQITEEEIEEALVQIRAERGEPQLRLYEIQVPVDSPEREAEIRQAVQGLVQQLRGGAGFAALARQFSKGPTASQGGDMGWVRRSQLPAELAEVAAEMQPGDISDPIRTIGGYFILNLRDRRSGAGVDAEKTTLTLKQVQLPLAPGGGTRARDHQLAVARAARANLRNCETASQDAAALGIEKVSDLGTVRLSELPEPIVNAVGNLPVDSVSGPIESPAGFMLLMVCDRDAKEQALPDRDEIRNRLLGDRLAVLAQRYIRDLKRDAVVELR